MTTTNTQTQPNEYFNLHARGTGFVTRIRTVAARKNRNNPNPSLYCTIHVPLDEKGAPNPRWTSFDVKCCGATKDFIESLRNDVAAGKKPAIAFLLGDFYADSYETPNGDIRAQYKARLFAAQAATERKALTLSGVGWMNGLQRDDNDVVMTKICALSGRKDNPGRTYLQMTVAPGAQVALMKVTQATADNPQARVFVSFEADQLMVEGFRFGEQSKYAGELGAACAANLTEIKSITVDGVSVYKQEKSAPVAVQASVEVVSENGTAAKTAPKPATPPQVEPDPMHPEDEESIEY